MMNLYRIETHEIDMVFAYVEAPLFGWEGLTERGISVGYVCAASPGKAKTLFINDEWTEEDLEYLDIKSCRIILRDVNRAPGLLESDDILLLQIQPDIHDGRDLRDYPAEAQP